MASRRISALKRQRRVGRNESAATECSFPLKKAHPKCKQTQTEISIKSSRQDQLIGLLIFWVIVAVPIYGYLYPYLPTPSESHLGIYTHAAVSSDATTNCSDIGVEILKQNGSAVDATIASMLCLGIINGQSCGIGGGAIMTIYIKDQKKAIAISGKETAPELATENMFKGDTIPSISGPLSMSVPGEIKGLWEAHKRFGKLPWKTLFQPAIKLCLEGYIVSYDMGRALKGTTNGLSDTATSDLRDFFWNKENSRWYQKGDIIKNPRLAKTLQRIADNGADEFYTGQLAKDLIADIQDGGGILTLNDLKNYKAEITPAITTLTSDGYRAFTTPTPSSGPVFLYMLNVLQGYNFTKANRNGTKASAETYHKIIEAMKFGYAARSHVADDNFFPNMTEFTKKIIDLDYAKLARQKITDKTHDYKYYGPAFTIVEDGGTSHLSVLAPNGDAVSMTSSINYWFGSNIRGKRTGIILNSQMDDFSKPNGTNKYFIPISPTNLIVPGKRPVSSMSPAIIINDKDGEVQLIIGSSGGSQITSAITQIYADTLWFGRNLKDSIDSPRLHHQLIPDEILIESNFPEEIYQGLEERGHTMRPVSRAYSRVQAIQRKGDLIHAYADYRKLGNVAGW